MFSILRIFSAGNMPEPVMIFTSDQKIRREAVLYGCRGRGTGNEAGISYRGT